MTVRPFDHFMPEINSQKTFVSYHYFSAPNPVHGLDSLLIYLQLDMSLENNMHIDNIVFYT